MKKILCLTLIAIITVSSSALAFCPRDFKVSKGRDLSTKNDVLLMDFSKMNPGDNPGFDVQGSTAEIIKTEGIDGKEQSAFCLTDTSADSDYNSGSNVHKNFSAIKSGIARFEIRFKKETVTTDHMCMNIFLYGGQGASYLNRLYISQDYSVPQLIAMGNGSFNLNNANRIKPGIWYTFTVVFNFDDALINAKLVEHAPGNEVLTYREAFNFNINFVKGESAFDRIHLQTNTGDGKLIVDYIKVDKPETDEVVEYVYPGPMDLPYVPTPVQGPVEGIINVKYNGEYMYFNEAPRLEGENLYVASRDALMELGLRVSYEDGALVGTEEGVRLELKAGSNEVIFNGVAHKISKPVTADNKAMVSLTELASVIGANVSYDATLNEYIITKEGAVQ